MAKQNSGRFEINLDKMQSVLLQLFYNPNMKPVLLEKNLEKFIPNYILKRPRFVDKFKHRALCYIHKNNNLDVVTQQDCIDIIEEKKSAADENLACEYPFHHQNLKQLLRNCMTGNVDSDI